MRPNLINRLKEEWSNLDPVDPLRGLLSDAIDALAEQPAKDEFKAAYIEAMVASNEAGFAGMSAAETIRELSRMVAEQPEQQEPVGALILGGVIDTSDGPEYEEWDIEWNNKAIEELQYRLVTGDPVTLNIYTSPPAQRTWVNATTWRGLTDEEMSDLQDRCGISIHQSDFQAIEAKLKEKNNG